jgi:preQ(0) biosynthesis protein QueC
MKAVCLLSGGMDSSTLAYVAKDMGYDIIALHFTYGQRTEEKERECALLIARKLEAIEFVEIGLEYFRKIGASSLTDPSIPIEDYAGEKGGVPTTYVPFRNANLLAIATASRKPGGRRRSSSASRRGITRVSRLPAGVH